MKRSIIIVAVVVAAIGIIPLVAQTDGTTSSPKAAVCEKGQEACQGQGCKGKGSCEEGKACEDCPKKASGECEGCDKKCEDCPKAGECKKACNMEEGASSEASTGCGMGMMRQGMGGGCGMGMGGCGQF